MRRTLAVLVPFALAGCSFHVHVHEAPQEAAAVADAPAPASPVAGAWSVRGRTDGDRGAWSATLVLDDESDEGWFDWTSERGSSGRELVRWELDEATGTLRLRGYALQHASGDISVGTYRIELADDGRLVHGTWGAPAAPGTWEAWREAR